MPERALGAAMRLLLGILGAAALVGGTVLAVTAMTGLARGSSIVLSLAGTAVAVLVMLGGLQLTRGALRGRIWVRRTGARRTPRESDR